MLMAYNYRASTFPSLFNILLDCMFKVIRCSYELLEQFVRVLGITGILEYTQCNLPQIHRLCVRMKQIFLNGGVLK